MKESRMKKTRGLYGLCNRKGKSFREKIEKVVKESEAKVVEGFSEVEICLMKRFLKQMIANMEQEESKKE